jgi:hypothetical protein
MVHTEDARPLESQEMVSVQSRTTAPSWVSRGSRGGWASNWDPRGSCVGLSCPVLSRAAFAGGLQHLEPSLCGPPWVPTAGQGLGCAWDRVSWLPPEHCLCSPAGRPVCPDCMERHGRSSRENPDFVGFLRERSFPLWDPQALLPGDSPFFTEVSRCVSQILNPNTPHPPSPSSLAPPRAGDKFLKFQLPAHIPKHQLPLSTLSTICCPCYI